MNITQKQIVKESFIRIFPVAKQITGLFFANLLAQDPTLEPIVLPYLHQEDSLQKALMTAKVAIDNLAIVQPALEKTGQTWAAQGLDATHYTVAYAALEETLIHALGNVSHEEKAAWETAYDEITSVMIQAGLTNRSLLVETDVTMERSFPRPETTGGASETITFDVSTTEHKKAQKPEVEVVLNEPTKADTNVENETLG